jgi:hypothetical protein
MYIDAHAHLDKYDSEIAQAIAEIEQHKIRTYQCLDGTNGL